MKPDEKTFWLEIAERELTQTLSLVSGMRFPNSYIKKEIKQFRIGKKQKTSLLQNLVNALNGPIPEFYAPSDTTNMEVNHVSLDTSNVPPVDKISRWKVVLLVSMAV